MPEDDLLAGRGPSKFNPLHLHGELYETARVNPAFSLHHLKPPLHGLPYVNQRFLPCLPLRKTSGKRRHLGDKISRFVLFNQDMEFHSSPPFGALVFNSNLSRKNSRCQNTSAKG